MPLNSVIMLRPLLLLPLLFCAAASASQSEVDAILDAVRAKHAPDPKTALFDVRATETKNGIVTLEGAANSKDALSDLRAEFMKRRIATDDRLRLLPTKDELGEKIWALVTAPEAAVLDARQNGRTVSVLKSGTPILRLEVKDGVTHAQFPDGTIGWIDSTLIRPMSDTELFIWNRREKVIVTAKDSAFTPERDQNAVKSLPKGTRLRLDGETDALWQGALADGTRGAAAKDGTERLLSWQTRHEVLRRENPAAFGKKTAETALRLAAAHQNDAALLREAFAEHDLIAPRDAELCRQAFALVKAGPAFRHLRAGDILFFRENADSPWKTAVSLGGSKFVKAGNGQSIDYRRLSKAEQKRVSRAFKEARRPDYGRLNDPCLTSTLANPFYQTPPQPLVSCTRQADVPDVR